ncbi:hypothetical protein GCM10010124_20890 [Pilimelia terevasa]|uniref:DUF402 domain-containing protein n=1 Tax=Pilimelia terevasa TaxID=53372 RepID=A0A8J3BLM2_9ACTN|nr:DUF402 domain-containing protein [Pilimelia terevasa]GGK28099.1 hypothetical protein GCM10010124_20890 [Pilimelia terevasa]
MFRFTPGEVVVHRNVRPGAIGWVRTAVVVADDDRGLLLWIPRGAPVGSLVAADGRGMRAMPFAEWVTLEHRVFPHTWHGPGVLKLLPPGAGHSVWWFFDDGGGFRNWYVNLEEPAVRWADPGLRGVDMRDQDLDLVVRPDLSWEWKDVGEFAERLALPGHYWVPDPDAVWAEGRRVARSAEAGAFPFDGTWCDFAPEAGWTVPAALPDGWDRPAAR